jgi:epoxyqueuosine reductase
MMIEGSVQFFPKTSCFHGCHGWIGKICLLITPEFGLRVLWTTILTDAPLNAAQKFKYEDCSDCTDCVNICSASAFTGEPFDENEPREVRYDAKKCERYIKKLKKMTLGLFAVYVFISAPMGKKKK